MKLTVTCQLWTANAARKLHHQAQARLVGEARWAAKVLALEEVSKWRHPQMGGRAFGDSFVRYHSPVRIVARPIQARAPLADPGAHAPVVKAIIDGLVDARVLAGDTLEYVASIEHLPPRKAGKREKEGVEITINEEGDNENNGTPAITENGGS